jgi:hypothetical protein
VFSQFLSVSDTRKKWFLRASEIERKKKVNCVSCEKGKKYKVLLKAENNLLKVKKCTIFV